MATASDTSSGEWTVITRADDKKQWGHEDSPLYRWSKDVKPGGAGGEGQDKGSGILPSPDIGPERRPE